MSLARVDRDQAPLHFGKASREAEVIALPRSGEHVPEELRPREYAFEHEFTSLPLGSINMLSQVRHDRNDQQTNLEQSIEEVGLRSFPEIAQFDDEHYLAYARIVMFRFGEVPKDEELLSMVRRHDDGSIYVVISGHSRIKAVTHNEEERAKRAWEAGYTTDPMAAEIKMTLQRNPDPGTVMLYQITENLHSRPAAEHIAGDVLSLYRYWLDTGELQSQEELFVRFGGKLPESTFFTIMNFSHLPADLQKKAFLDKKYAFNVAARVGALAPHKRALEIYKRTQGERDPNEDEMAEIDTLVNEYVRNQFSMMGAAIHKSRGYGINLQIQTLENERKKLIQELANEGAALFGSQLEDWGMTPEQLAQEEIKRMRERASRAVEELIERPIGYYDAVAAEYGAIAGVDVNPNSIRARQEKLIEVVTPIMGQVGVVPLEQRTLQQEVVVHEEETLLIEIET